MIRISSLFISCILLTATLSAQQVKSEIIKENHSITQKTSFRTDGKISERNIMMSPESWYEEINIYEDSFLVSSDHFLDGVNIASYIYEYNNANLLTERIEKYGDSISGRIQYEYNDKQQLISEHIISNKEKEITITYEYRDDGKILERTEKITDTGIAVFNCEYFEYDDNGLLTQRTQMSGVDTLICQLYSYDEFQRCNSISVTSGGELITRIEWEFYHNTELIKKETHFSNGYIVRIEKFKYNFKGLIKKETVIDYRIFENMPAPKKVVYKHLYTYYED